MSKTPKSPFTDLQQTYIQIGDKRSLILKERITEALGHGNLKLMNKRHYYIAGGAGVGKTNLINKTAEELKTPLIRIQSAASMNALTIQLAVASYMSQGKPLHVFIDDCDSIFTDRVSLSVMKGVLDEDRSVLAWNKNMSAAIAIFEKSENPSDVIKSKALRNFQPVGSVGVEIPTGNMTFIITSNHYLASSNPPPTKARRIDEAGIHDRVNYIGYPLNQEENWGWMASTTLNSNIHDLTNEQKYVMLNWMFDNLAKLQSMSLRAIKDLAADMINHPENFKDYWETRLSCV